MPDFVKALDAEIAELERQLEDSPLYVKLREAKRLREMYSLRAPDPRDYPVKTRQTAPVGGVSGEILTAVREYIAGRKEPTPTREIVAMLEKRGIEINATVPQNVVSSTLSRAPDIQANGRRGWTLKENEPPLGGSETEEGDASSHTQSETSQGLPTAHSPDPAGQTRHWKLPGA